MNDEAGAGCFVVILLIIAGCILVGVWHERGINNYDIKVVMPDGKEVQYENVKMFIQGDVVIRSDDNRLQVKLKEYKSLEIKYHESEK